MKLGIRLLEGAGDAGVAGGAAAGVGETRRETEDAAPEEEGDASVATDSELERVISSAAAAVEEFSAKDDKGEARHNTRGREFQREGRTTQHWSAGSIVQKSDLSL